MRTSLPCHRISVWFGGPQHRVRLRGPRAQGLAGVTCSAHAGGVSAELLWTLIPLAAVIALSPIHLIPAVLMIFSPRAGASSAGYVAAWVAGLLLLTSSCAAVAVVADHSGLVGADGAFAATGGPVSPSTAKVILGVLLVLVGLRRWLRRQGHGGPPRWVTSLASLNPRGAAKVGLLLSLANPKVMLMAGAAGLAIGAGAGIGHGSVALFVALASVTVVLPLLGYLVWGERFKAPLARVRDQLLDNHAGAMAVMIGALGLIVMVEGLAGL